MANWTAAAGDLLQFTMRLLLKLPFGMVQTSFVLAKRRVVVYKSMPTRIVRHHQETNRRVIYLQQSRIGTSLPSLVY